MLARAKINLFLHVGERRAGDRLHRLGSLVVRATVGDRVQVARAPRLELVLAGRNAGAISATDNLILDVAGALDPLGRARIELDKELPVAAGLGGGSADAAVALGLLNGLWQCGLSDAELAARGMEIGADIPVCLHGGAAMIGGAGEVVTPVSIADLHAVIVDTGAHVRTASVFALHDREFSQGGPVDVEAESLPDTAESLIAFLGEATGNDLTESACSIAPEVGEALDALGSDTDVVLARMSGSGGACFGICQSADRAAQVRRRLVRRHSRWWVRDCVLLGGGRVGRRPAG